MKKDNIIICEQCYEENNSLNKKCKNCGALLYKNNEEQELEIKTPAFEKNSPLGQNDKILKNKIASLLKILSAIFAIIGTIIGITQLEIVFIGFAYIVCSIIVSIFIYALGEIVQLLEDIKNK